MKSRILLVSFFPGSVLCSSCFPDKRNHPRQNSYTSFGSAYATRPGA